MVFTNTEVPKQHRPKKQGMCPGVAGNDDARSFHWDHIHVQVQHDIPSNASRKPVMDRVFPGLIHLCPIKDQWQCLSQCIHSFIILRLHNDIACGFAKRVYICNTNSTSSKFRTLMSGISSYQQQKKPSHI
jgi:hypothetical protein